jgi:hypothetical protein
MVVHGQLELTTLDNYFKPAMQLLKDKVAVVKVVVEGFEDKVIGLQLDVRLTCRCIPHTFFGFRMACGCLQRTVAAGVVGNRAAVARAG